MILRDHNEEQELNRKIESFTHQLTEAERKIVRQQEEHIISITDLQVRLLWIFIIQLKQYPCIA